MNIPATLDLSTYPEDLVLRFVGGANDGESVSISTECCTLGAAKQSEQNGSVLGQCAIYRGPAGVAVQSHGDELLINGEAKSVHWLEPGDTIQVSNSQTVEVVQLGTLATAEQTSEVAGSETAEAEPVAPEVVPNASAGQVEPVVGFQPTKFETEAAGSGMAVEAGAQAVDLEGDRIGFVSHAVQGQLARESSAFSEPSSLGQSAESYASEGSLAEPVQEAESESPVQETPVQETPVQETASTEQPDEVGNQRLDSLENSVNQLHDQAANVDRRFDRLEDSLSALTEHLERLAVGSLTAASVEPEPEASLPAGFVAQPAQESVATSIPEAPAETASLGGLENVETPHLFQTPELPAAVAEQAAASAGDQHEESIATLFSELANTDTPGVSTAQAAVAPVAEPSPFEQADSQAIAEVGPAVNSLPSAVEAIATEQPAQGTTAPIEDQVHAPRAEEIISAALGIDVPTSADQPAGHFAEQMLASMHDETPTLSSEDIASAVGLGIEKQAVAVEGLPAVGTPSAVEVAPAIPAAPEMPAAGEAAPVHRPVAPTESVADIFSRLRSAASASEGAGENAAPAPPLPQAVRTTYEDVQASVLAAFNGDVSATPEANPPSPVETVAAETVNPLPEAVESSGAAGNVNSVMEQLRNSVDAEQGSEATEDSQPTGVAENKRATDLPTGGRKQQDSVEDYMSLLMSRMNGDSDGTQVSAEGNATADSFSAVSDFNKPQGAQSGLLDEVVVNTLLTEEEFVPKQKPMPIKSLDKMRELANSTSRSAVQRSERAVQIERKKSLILQALAFGSLALAVVMFWVNSYVFGGAFALIFIVTSAYFIYDVVNPARPADASSAKTDKKNPQGQAAREPSGE